MVSSFPQTKCYNVCFSIQSYLAADLHSFMQNTHNMKKITLLLLCIATLGLASCKKDTIINQTTPNRTIIFDRSPNSWKLLSGTTNTYYVDLDASEIDNINVRQEGVLVYISTDGTTTTGYFQIPNSAQRYDYDIYTGYIRVYSYGLPPTTTTRIKVVLIAADNIT